MAKPVKAEKKEKDDKPVLVFKLPCKNGCSIDCLKCGYFWAKYSDDGGVEYTPARWTKVKVMSQPKLSKQDIESILSKVKFRDRTFRLLEKGDGFLLQMQYMEPDVTKPDSEPVLQSTRKYYISPYMTESEIVETAWACVQRSQLHIASEYFTYKGHRVYSQHFHVDGRLELCKQGHFDGRIPIQK